MELKSVRTFDDATTRLGLPAFKVVSDGPVEAYVERDAESGKERRKVKFTASSNGVDFIPDVFSDKALKRMEEAAPDTIVFTEPGHLDPEHIFGSILTAKLKHAREDEGEAAQCGRSPIRLLCLEFDCLVEDESEEAVKLHDEMLAGYPERGASVSVLIMGKTSEEGSLIVVIDDVYYLECSLFPLHPETWLESASKALTASLKAEKPEGSREVPGATVRKTNHGVEVSFPIEALGEPRPVRTVTTGKTLREMLVEKGRERGLSVTFHPDVAEDEALDSVTAWMAQMAAPNWDLMLRYLRECGFVADESQGKVEITRAETLGDRGKPGPREPLGTRQRMQTVREIQRKLAAVKDLLDDLL